MIISIFAKRQIREYRLNSTYSISKKNGCYGHHNDYEGHFILISWNNITISDSC